VDLILNIDTAVQGASISLAANGTDIDSKQTFETNDSAAWIHVAIRDLLHENDLTVNDLKAIGLSSGPGSYTGLRVGMATAKGLCYALSVPLITVNTLEMMASAAAPLANSLLCPMIDARRMEVFTGVFNPDLSVVLPVSNLVLEDNSFADLLDSNKVTFFGNGSDKWKTLVKHENALFLDLSASASDLSPLTYRLYSNKSFTELAYSEPLYGKEFYSPPARPLV
jgi:tRNA threonylcarbamoyladenosine biosynthesis protein TsaB